MIGLLIACAVWFLIRLPMACLMFALGVFLCMTLILMPLGLKCISAAGDILFG